MSLLSKPHCAVNKPNNRSKTSLWNRGIGDRYVCHFAPGFNMNQKQPQIKMFRRWTRTYWKEIGFFRAFRPFFDTKSKWQLRLISLICVLWYFHTFTWFAQSIKRSWVLRRIDPSVSVMGFCVAFCHCCPAFCPTHGSAQGVFEM